MAIELGQEVKDKITGFSGVATGRTEFMTGCNQILVAPKVGADGAFKESQWFDEQRLDVTNTKAITLDNSKTPGFDKPAPKR